MWYFYLANGVLCLWMAYEDAKSADDGKYEDINHDRNAVVHISAAVIIAIAGGWLNFFAALLQAVIVFDIAYNLFRKNPRFSPFYLPISPRSWKDRLEKKLFFNSGLVAKIFYLIAFIVIICIA